MKEIFYAWTLIKYNNGLIEKYLETVTNLIMNVMYWWLWWAVDHFLVFITALFSHLRVYVSF